MSVSVLEITHPSTWFEVFRDQSLDPESLGELIWSTELGGGLSGARVAVGLFDRGQPGLEDRRPIVFKWGPLHEILSEATARRDLAVQAGGKQLGALQGLRRRGASHVAIRANPSGAHELFGIVASLYEGTFDREQSTRISDFQVFIRDVYVRNAAVSDDDLEYFFKLAAKAVAPEGDKTRGAVNLIELPDLRGMNAKYTKGLEVLRSRGTDVSAIDGISGWLHSNLGEEVKYLDSRVVHGDPRFANVMLNRVVNEVSLIDFGDGGGNRHVFHDLARFEVDVLFRSTAPGEHARTKEILARLAYLYTDRKATTRTPRAHKVAALWRSSRNQHVTDLIRPEVMNLYSMFILNELFRRASWYMREEETFADVGALPSEIVTAIDAVVSYMKRMQRGNDR